MLRDEVVENRGHVEAKTVETNVNASRFVPAVLSGHIDGDGAEVPGKILESGNSNVNVFPAGTEEWACQSGPNG